MTDVRSAGTWFFRKTFVAVGTVVSLLVLAATAEAQEPVEFDAKAVSVTLSGRVQLQGTTSSCSDFPFEADSPCVDQVPSADAFFRRIRLSAFVEINDFISAKVEPDFSGENELGLADAYGRLTFSDHARVQIGQFKRPFDGFALVSSSKLLTVERDLDIPGVPGLRAASLAEFSSGFNLGLYDIGGMFFGETEDDRLQYWAGFFNGERVGETGGDDNGGKQFVGRLQYNLSAGEIPLSVAAAAMTTALPFEGEDDQPGFQGSSEYYQNFEVYAELGDFDRGPHVQAGVIFGDNPTENELGTAPTLGAETGPGFASMWAWQAIGAYKQPLDRVEFLEAVEPAFRITRAEPNTDVDDDEVWGLTPGVNIYFHGRNKLQLNWDFASFSGDGFDDVNSFKTQFQVYF